MEIKNKMGNKTWEISWKEKNRWFGKKTKESVKVNNRKNSCLNTLLILKLNLKLLLLLMLLPLLTLLS